MQLIKKEIKDITWFFFTNTIFLSFWNESLTYDIVNQQKNYKIIDILIDGFLLIF